MMGSDDCFVKRCCLNGCVLQLNGSVRGKAFVDGSNMR